MEVIRVNGKQNKKNLIKNIAIPLIGGSLVGWLANRRSKEKFERLEQPNYAPPASVFPIVWTSLYALMGLAKYRASEASELKEKKLPPTYEIQLGLNFIWSFLFFKWNLRGTALMEMTVLLGALCLTTYQFYQQDRKSGLFMVPYIGWVIFALCLNYSFWKLNRK